MDDLGRRPAGFFNTVRLGLRLARAGGKVRMTLVVAGALVASILILISLSFQNAVSNQHERQMERAAYSAPIEEDDEWLEDLGDDVEVYYGPQELPIGPLDNDSTLHAEWLYSGGLGPDVKADGLLLTGDGPVPPGIPALPTPDEAYVSPALKDLLLDQNDAGEMPELIAGKELLEISSDGLRDPNELFAYIGVTEAEFPGDLDEASAILSWGIKFSDGSTGYFPTSDLVFPVLVFLLAPAVFLLATTTRLASSVRTERMAALRLLGVSRERTRLIAGIEAGVLATLGVLLGFALLPLLASLSAGREFFGVSWFASDFHPNLPLGISALLFVPLLTVLTALIVLRKVTQNPLQIRRKAANPRPSLWRLAPLAIGSVLLGVQATGVFQKIDSAGAVTAYAFLAGAALTGAGILLAVPVFVRRFAALLGRRTSRPTLLLAARRTQYEPAVLNRLVGGFVLVLFIATGGQAVVLAFESTPQYVHAHESVTGESATVRIIPPEGIAPDEELTTADLATLPGVGGTVEYSEITTSETTVEFGKNNTPSIVVACADLAHFGEVHGTCSGADAYLLHAGDGAEYAIEDGAESIPLGNVSDVLELDFNYYSGFYSLAFPPDSPLLTDLKEPLPTHWLVELPAEPQAWAEFEAAVADLNPEYWVSTPDLDPLDDVADVRAGIWIGTGIAGAIALITLLITAVDNGIARRPQIAMQRAFGVSLTRVRRSQILQALLPLVVGVPLAGAAGILAGQAYISLDEMKISTSYWSAIIIALALATAAAVLIALATLPAIGGKISPRSLRRE